MGRNSAGLDVDCPACWVGGWHDNSRGFSDEFCLRHASGRWIWMRGVGQVIQDESGTATGAIVSHIDISDIKNNEQMLRNGQILAGLRECRLDAATAGLAPLWMSGSEPYPQGAQKWLQVPLRVAMKQGEEMAGSRVCFVDSCQ